MSHPIGSGGINRKFNALISVFIAILLLSFHFYFIYFINSTYIKNQVGNTGVSIVYAVGAIINILVFMIAPKLLKKFGLFRLTMLMALGELISLILLAFPFHPIVIIGSFLLHTAVSPVLMYTMDLFLERYESKESVGNIRGIALTLWNIPILITPFIAGLLINTNISIADFGGNIVSWMISLTAIGYWKIYLISSLILMVFMLILRLNFSTIKDLDYPTFDLRETLKHFYKHQYIFDVFMDRILLNLFFAWNVIYIPIYLHEYIGFSWSETGLLMSLSALPSVLFQRKIGQMQDKKSEEKHLLVAGFIIMSVISILIPFIATKNMAIWIIILFITYFGASLVEVCSESYFFRHVKQTNAGFIGLFRMTRTLPYIIIPPLVGIILALFPFNYMFVFLGLIMLTGVRYAFKLR